ncbi:hypothetical protein P0Y35_15510 [Kiritimatiellaeota bacterium B1221]|nr:hypothetical protein [Kiritimatiellaeota bacterium B1221]
MMKGKKFWLKPLGLGCILILNRGMAEELGPYQLILDKQLLGVEQRVPDARPQAKVAAARPSWAQEYRLTMITQDSAGLRVGLQSLNDNAAYLLVEGESSEWSRFELLSGDYENGSAVIRYQGTEHQFSLQAGAPPVSRGIQEVPTAAAVTPPISVLRERRMVRRNSNTRPRP